MKVDAEEAVARKEDLAWFQKRRERWKNAPRPKLKPLSPPRAVEASSTPTSTTPKSATRTPILKNDSDDKATTVPGATRALNSDSKPSFSFGAPSVSALVSKPLVGAPLSTSSNPFTFGSSEQTIPSSGPVLGSVQLKPSITSESATHTTATPAKASIVTSNSNIPVTLTPVVSEKQETSTVANTSSIFAGVNLTPSVPASQPTTASVPAFGAPPNAAPSAKATDGGSIFANINLTPSSGLGSDESKSTEAKDLADKPNKEPSSEALKPFTFSFGNAVPSYSQAPLTKPTGKVRNPTTAAKSMTGSPAPKENTTVAPTFPAASAASDKPTVGSIFANINLVPDRPATKEMSNLTTVEKALVPSASSTSSATNVQTVSTAPSKSSTTSIFANIQLVPDPPTTDDATKASMSDTATTSPATAVPPVSTTEVPKSSSLFGNAPTFGATPAPSPFTFGAATAVPGSTTAPPVFRGLPMKAKTEEGKSTAAKVEASPGKDSSPRDSLTAAEKGKQGKDEPLSATKSTSSVSLPSSDTKPDHKSRLIAFYKKHNPDKLDTVDATLEKYKGKVDELFQKLQAKYEATPTSKYPPPTGEGPSCFLEFAIDGDPVGTVVVKLFRDKVPLASDNFHALCTGSKGKGRMGKPLCYKNSKVHRVVPLFCTQMGDFTRGDGTGGESIYEPNKAGVSDTVGRFKDESFLQHSKKGLLSMANNGPNRNGSQFFFTLRPCPSLDGKHVVFGEVTSGMDVVEKIGQLKTTPKQRPEQSVEIVNCGEVVDGKEIPCKLETAKAPAPFAFGSALGTGQTKSLGFGNLAAFATSNNAFGFGAPNSSGSSPFTCGAAASSLQSGGGFGSSSTGAAKTSAAGSTGTTPTSNASPFTFGSTSGASGMPSFGSLATSAASNPNPFTFGSMSSAMTGSGKTQSSVFTTGATSSDGGSKSAFAPRPTTGFSFRNIDKDDEESDDDSSRDADFSDED